MVVPPRNIDIPVSHENGISVAIGDGYRGHEVLDKIQDKATRFVEENGYEVDTVILDAQSYLDVVAYLHSMLFVVDSHEVHTINTPYGTLNFMVLPQMKKRIQVINSSPMKSATMAFRKEFRKQYGEL